MLYSVWNWDTLQYDYYRGGGLRPGQKPPARQIPSSQFGANAGVQVEAALPTLPKGVVYVGSGAEAKGRVTRDMSAPLGRFGEVETMDEVLGVTIGILCWYPILHFGASAARAVGLKPRADSLLGKAILVGSVYGAYRVGKMIATWSWSAPKQQAVPPPLPTAVI